MKIFENLDLQNLNGETWKDIKDYEELYQVGKHRKIIDIKTDIKIGELTLKEIAEKYNVSKITVSRIKTGKRWSQIKI